MFDSYWLWETNRGKTDHNYAAQQFEKVQLRSFLGSAYLPGNLIKKPKYCIVKRVYQSNLSLLCLYISDVFLHCLNSFNVSLRCFCNSKVPLILGDGESVTVFAVSIGWDTEWHWLLLPATSNTKFITGPNFHRGKIIQSAMNCDHFFNAFHISSTDV